MNSYNAFCHTLASLRKGSKCRWRFVIYVMPTTQKFQHLTRAKEVVITRLRIGHTKATKSHILSRVPQTACHHCGQTLTIEHVLLECAVLEECHDEYYTVDSLNALFETIPETCIVEFLREAGFFYLIWCNVSTSTSSQTWTIWPDLSNLFREWKQLWDTFTCVGRLICPEGRVSSLNKSNPTNQPDHQSSSIAMFLTYILLFILTSYVSMQSIVRFFIVEWEAVKKLVAWIYDVEQTINRSFTAAWISILS